MYVFGDSQRCRLLFPVVDYYVPAVLTRLLAAFEAGRNGVLKINVSCP